jgi:hypothetical protein
MEQKIAISPARLCEGLPKQFVHLLQEIKSTDDEAGPSYQRLRDIFRKLAKAEGIEYDNVFDWTIRLFQETKSSEDEQ